MMTDELNPCTRCGGKLRPVKSGDGRINALYCGKCKTVHMLNDECRSMGATIGRYNRKYTEQMGGN